MTENISIQNEHDPVTARAVDAPSTPREQKAAVSEPARHEDPSLSMKQARRPTVEWVRPTELAQRAGAKILSIGADANQRLHAAMREAVRGGGTHLRDALHRRESALADDTPESTRGTAARREVIGR